MCWEEQNLRAPVIISEESDMSWLGYFPAYRKEIASWCSTCGSNAFVKQRYKPTRLKIVAYRISNWKGFHEFLF